MMIEDQVRAVTKAAAETITPDSVPPLRLSWQSVRLRVTRDERRRPGWHSWAAPLGAAAMVVAVVVGMATIQGGARSPRSAPPRVGLTAGPPVTSVTGTGAIPAYYVALAAAGNPNFVPSHAVVKSTASGRVLTTISPPAHGTFVAVTAAAGDRTFVLGEQPWAIDNAGQTFKPETFYLLTLDASGSERTVTRLPGVPVQPQGSMVTGLALSPDGRELAEAFQPAHPIRPLMEIRIYSIPGGAVRTWSGDGTIGASENDSAAISWTADGRTLAFDWADGREVSVRLLNTSAGGSLIADSRVAVLIAKAGLICETDEIVSPDGSVIACGASALVPVSGPGHSPRTTARQAFIEYSVATGKVATVVGERQVPGPGGIGLYWSGVSGKVLIVAIPSGSGTRVGVLRGQAFAPLPGAANPGAAAW